MPAQFDCSNDRDLLDEEILSEYRDRDGEPVYGLDILVYESLVIIYPDLSMSEFRQRKRRLLMRRGK